MSEMVDAKALQTTSLFVGLSEHDAQVATDDIEVIRLKAGEILFRQGDEGATIFFVVSGQLEVRLSVPGHEDRVVSIVGPSSIIGEMSLLLDEPRAATVSALGETELWKISRVKFEVAQQANERWANQLLLYMAQILSRRLGNMNREIVEMMSKPKTATPQTSSPRELEQMFQNMFANL